MQYQLGTLLLVAVGLSAVGVLTFSWLDILAAAVFLPIATLAVNAVIGRLWKIPVNHDSAIISGLILALIFGPQSIATAWPFLLFAAGLAMASKYLLAIGHRHIFNPAAVGAILTGLILHNGASWWVGVPALLPVVIVGGYLMVKRVHRQVMVVTYLIAAAGAVVIELAISGQLGSVGPALNSLALYSAIWFMATVMLIEPMTSPTTTSHQIVYGLLVALVPFAVRQVGWTLLYPLEAGLLAGNLYNFVVRRDQKMELTLKEKIKLGPNIISFLFDKPARFKHSAGQFLEWTLPHAEADDRGYRRWFTVSSSPTEPNIRLTTKFAERSSSFKTALHNLKPGQKISAANLEGDFVLPENRDEKLVFIAGGIGITPFRAMTKYLLDTKQSQDIVLLYSAKTAAEVVFKEIFAQAEQALWLKPNYVLTDPPPANWTGQSGFIDAAMIKRVVGDWQNRVFYISGPEPMVEAFEKMLAAIGIADNKIKRDFFPGYTDTHQPS